MSVVFKLQEEELDVLMQYQTDPETTDSSFQELLEKLRSQVNPQTGELSLSEEDVQNIQNYVSESGNGSASESLQQLLEKISEHRRIIAFRNILIHGYDIVDETIVWQAAKNHLPILIREVKEILGT